jgi:hypothetical protein
MRSTVLVLEDDAIGLIGGGGALLLLLLLLLLLKLLMLSLMVLLAVLRVLMMMMVAGKVTQTGQARRVRLRRWRERGLRVGILCVLRVGAVAVHQSLVLCDLMGSIKLLRRKGRLLLSGHGVDGRTHGLAMVTICNSGGTPALGHLWDGGQRGRSRRISSFRHAGLATALARAWLGLRRASGST